KTKSTLTRQRGIAEEHAEQESGGGELREWMASAIAVLQEHHRPRAVTPDVLALARSVHASGVTAEQLADAARAMMQEKSLDNAGLPWLLKELPRWRANARKVDAAERWALYSREGFTHHPIYGFEEKLADLVQRGVWPSVEAARAELAAVKPWDIGRATRDKK